MKGKFIVFEGINGCGKSTQLDLSAEWINALGITVRTTKEPSQSKYGLEAIRILKEAKDPYADAQKCVELFAQDRKMHNETEIKPNIDSGIWVLCDRYWHSNFVFQMTQGVEFDAIKNANTNGLLIPDLTIIYDLPVSVADDRLKKRDVNRRKFDSNKDFMEKVRQNYNSLDRLLKGFDTSVHYINANRSINDVFADTKKAIETRFRIN